MGDQNINQGGQVNVQGRRNTLTGANTFNQQNINAGDIDLKVLAEELTTVLNGLRTQASTPEEFQALAKVSEAKAAAEAGDANKAVSALKAVGKFVLDFASKVGAGYVVKLLTSGAA